jgi:pyrroline-5-carboxylate reductase
MTTWGFIGCGNLAQAIVVGAIENQLFKPQNVLITNRTLSKSKAFSRRVKVRIAKSNAELIENAQVIVVGTKPLEILPVLEELRNSNLSQKIVISLAAGVDGQTLQLYCGKARSVIRVMANTPVVIQQGFFGIQSVKTVPKDKALIFRFFNQLGQAILVNDDVEMNSVTAGVASGVGFVFFFMEQFESWFVSKGLSRSQARLASVKTFLGASELARFKSDLEISKLRDLVTSKKGTTLAGLIALKRGKVGPGLRSGLEAAFKRSSELAKSLRQKRK